MARCQSGQLGHSHKVLVSATVGSNPTLATFFVFSLFFSLNMKVNWIDEKETLERLINEGVSYERIGRRYSVTGAAVKKAAKKLGIELEQKREINPNEHFNKGKISKNQIIKQPTLKKEKKKEYCINCGKEIKPHKGTKTYKFCSHECQNEFRNKEYIKRWQNGEENGTKGNYYQVSGIIRKYIFEKYGGKCQICGWGEENPITHKVPLQIHHIDGDCTNNKEENLQLLCPNCHSLTETFGSLNENSKRVFRKQKGNI